MTTRPRDRRQPGYGDLHISLVGEGSLAKQVYQQIRAAVVDGRLRPGDPLPSTRRLSHQLGVSRTTVAAAYERLAADGLVSSRPGGETRVSERAPSGRRIAISNSPLRPRPIWNDVTGLEEIADPGAQFDFRPGVPDATRFPYATWRSLLLDALRPSAATNGPSPGGGGGHPQLCEAIARYLAVARSVRLEADNVLVTNGSQQAIDLVAQVLLGPDDVVAVEKPGRLSPRRAFLAHGSRVVAVPVDEEGLIVDALPDNTRLVHVTPNHQYPLGMTMSRQRRTALLEWAERVNAAILEDDSYAEFRFGGHPLPPPLQSLDRSGRVLYVGSFSRMLLPTLRIGFLVCPQPLQEALRAAKLTTDGQTAWPLQAAMARFINDGLLARHLRHMRRLYAERRQQVRTTLAEELNDHLVLLPSAAGLHFTTTLRNGADDTAITGLARTVGLAVHPLSMYLPGSMPPGLLIGYGAITTESIPDGLRHLKACIEKFADEA
jgi:GntR family transcriptional regulator/MocR family aminotransferase